jgi:membrane fusion protein (multidrug efflux system)
MIVRAFEEGGQKPIAEGTISAIEPAVDAVVRSIKVRASFAADQRWRPGMFLRVEVVLPERGNVVAVPLTSVVRASYGDSVFVVDTQPGADGKPRRIARQQFVKLGAGRGDFVAVLDGVKPGEEVVSSGAFKLRNGLPLTIDDKVAAVPQLAPRPENR